MDPNLAVQGVRLMIVDVDGTLLTPDKVLTERAVGAVRELRKAGIEVALTSGRPPRGLRMLIEPLGLTTPLAAFNGGMFVHPDLTVIEQRILPPDAARKAVALIKRHGLDVWVYRGADWYVTESKAPHVDREQRTVQFAPTIVPALDDLLDKAVKIVGVSDDFAAVARCEAEAQHLDGVYAARSQPYYLDVTHPDANKGMVVKYLSQLLSIPRGQIATIGDMPNDVQMFRGSRVSIAMGNASAEVRHQARHVTPSNTDEGFARAVEDIILPEALDDVATGARPAAKARPHVIMVGAVQKSPEGEEGRGLMEIPRRLYMLPFDHRESFEHRLFGFTGALDSEEVSQIVDAKRLIYEGFLRALESDVPREAAALLVDEQFGREILRDAKVRGLMTACPVERSGQKEFTFEYGNDFAAHIEDVDPTLCKALVRYNPEGDPELNRRQGERLQRLSDYLSNRGRGFMVELLVPPEPHQLAEAGDQDSYDSTMRPGLMVRAIESFHQQGIEPTVWKIEGLESTTDCQDVAAAALRQGRSHVRCIVLGRNAPEAHVERWLRAAAAVPAFIGFAVGRSTFARPLRDWRQRFATREQAVQQIADRYGLWTRTFVEAQSLASAHAEQPSANP